MGMFGGENQSQSDFKKGLNKVYTWYTGGFIAFVIVLAILEQMGLPKAWIGYLFLAATVLLYAGIGVMSRTNDAAEYYVAGRRVPAIYNGMATGADWMSAASFIGMAGTLYLTGYSGLAFIMGWTGGYCLVALFLAPYMRKFGQFTVPDFLGERYGGNLPRFIGIVAAIFAAAEMMEGHGGGICPPGGKNDGGGRQRGWDAPLLLAVGYGMVYSSANRALGPTMTHVVTGHITRLGEAFADMSLDGVGPSVRVLGSFAVGVVIGAQFSRMSSNCGGGFPFFATIGIAYALVLASI